MGIQIVLNPISGQFDMLENVSVSAGVSTLGASGGDAFDGAVTLSQGPNVTLTTNSNDIEIAVPAPSANFLVTGGGKIGIGTNSPTASLHIAGETEKYGIYSQSYNGGDGGLLHLYRPDEDSHLWISAFDAANLGIHASSGRAISFNVDAQNGYSGTRAMTISPSADVGLGGVYPFAQVTVQFPVTDKPGLAIGSQSVSAFDADSEKVGGVFCLATLHADESGSIFQQGYIADGVGKIGAYQAAGNCLDFDFYDQDENYQGTTNLLSFGGIWCGGSSSPSSVGLYKYADGIGAIGPMSDPSSATANTPALVFTEQLNVGIGTVDPQAKLHFKSNDQTNAEGIIIETDGLSAARIWRILPQANIIYLKNDNESYYSQVLQSNGHISLGTTSDSGMITIGARQTSDKQLVVKQLDNQTGNAIEITDDQDAPLFAVNAAGRIVNASTANALTGSTICTLGTNSPATATTPAHWMPIITPTGATGYIPIFL